MLDSGPQESDMCSEKFFDSGQVTESWAILVEIERAHLLIEEARTESLIIVEKFLSDLKEHVIDLFGCDSIISVNLSE